MSRHQSRREMDLSTRMYLVEGDLDDLESALKDLTVALRKWVWAFVGMLISLTTTSILLAMNLAVGS